MLFKKNLDKKMLQKFHSQQKKTNKLLGLIEKDILKNERSNEQFNNLFKTSGEIHSIIIEDLSVSKIQNICDISLLYINLSNSFFTFYFCDFKDSNKNFYKDFFKNLIEIFEIFETCIFHIIEHPNIARENFGKKDIFLYRIYESITNCSNEKNIDRHFLNEILNSINNISFILKKILY
ncbi:MAG: hypothetical protein M0R46_05610 [Candidatus Muirbacterium halophilum]|nr:hypothetical protein [Candidatus Muirbacterium halophilum]